MTSGRLSHGHAKKGRISPTYRAWCGMWTRCTNPKRAMFRHYGGRGITVCARWQSFDNFLADMGERPNGKTLDRYPDRDGDYTRTNCRWATPREQRLNSSQLVRWFSYNGERKSLTEWCKTLALSYGTVRYRLDKRGESFSEAIHAGDRMRKNDKHVTIDGVTMRHSQWLQTGVVSRSTILKRIKHGWSYRKAIFTIPQSGRRTDLLRCGEVREVKRRKVK